MTWNPKHIPANKQRVCSAHVGVTFVELYVQTRRMTTSLLPNRCVNRVINVVMLRVAEDFVFSWSVCLSVCLSARHFVCLTHFKDSSQSRKPHTIWKHIHVIGSIYHGVLSLSEWSIFFRNDCCTFFLFDTFCACNSSQIRVQARAIWKPRKSSTNVSWFLRSADAVIATCINNLKAWVSAIFSEFW